MRFCRGVHTLSFIFDGRDLSALSIDTHTKKMNETHIGNCDRLERLHTGGATRRLTTRFLVGRLNAAVIYRVLHDMFTSLAPGLDTSSPSGSTVKPGRFKTERVRSK